MLLSHVTAIFKDKIDYNDFFFSLGKYLDGRGLFHLVEIMKCNSNNAVVYHYWIEKLSSILINWCHMVIYTVSINWTELIITPSVNQNESYMTYYDIHDIAFFINNFRSAPSFNGQKNTCFLLIIISDRSCVVNIPITCQS